MGEQLDLELDDESAVDEKDHEDESETEKPSKKIYKGQVLKVAELITQLKGPTPIQPIKQRIPGQNKSYRLPPTFVATRFRQQWGTTILDYYDPKSGLTTHRNVPVDFELNVLTGRRGKELTDQWDKTKIDMLHSLIGRMGCSIGSDPEIFAEKDGEVFPAWQWVSGKDKPATWNFGSGSMTGSCYWDGFQAEFTTPPSVTCAMVLSDTIHSGLLKLHNLATKHGARLSMKSVYQVNPDILAKAAPEHVAFGCSPSKNVYGLKGNTEDGKNVPYRFAGGHIHLGLADRREKEALIPIVRGLDAILGVAAVSMFANMDNPIRRQFYGQPGEYRTPAHGLEYRVLSNAWLCHPLAMHLVYDLTRSVGGLVQGGMFGDWKATEQETVDTIMTHDVDKARAILERNLSLFTAVIKLAGGAYFNYPQVAVDLWRKGIEHGVKDINNLTGNWLFGGGWHHSHRMFASYAPRIANGEKV